MKVYTAIFGEVEIGAVYEDEGQARAEGYCYDAHAYIINQFGGIEPPGWKVLARSEGRTGWRFAAIRNDKEERK